MPAKELITKSQLIAEIRAIAAEFPDRTYVFLQETPGRAICLYAPVGLNPDGCVVGFALYRLGVRRELLAKVDATLSPGWGRSGPRLVLDGVCTPAALESTWVRNAQQVQDAGGTCSEAVRSADAFRDDNR